MPAKPIASRRSKISPCLGLLICAIPAALSSAGRLHAADQPSGRARGAAGYGALPLAFEPNRGQSDPAVRFVAHGEGYSLILTDSEAVLALRKSVACAHGKIGSQLKTQSCVANHDLLRMKITGTRNTKAAKIYAEAALPGRVNYFIGNDPAKWLTDLPTWAKVRYAGIYPGVDMVYHGNQRQLEYDFVLAPGADASRIRLRFAGAQKLSLDLGGNLIAKTTGGEVTLDKPVIYQDVPGTRRAIDGEFALLSPDTVGFRLGSYDHRRPLVIDPVLVYGTYLGGSSNDSANAIAVDSEGSAYLTGSTSSVNFPTVDALQRTDPNSKTQVVFVTKLAPSGSSLAYSTYLGGATSNGDSGNGIAVDSTGAAYIAGYTFASDFPTKDPIQSSNKAYSAKNGGSNAFVAKLTPSGSELAFSTYLGGSASDSGSAIALDNDRNVYLTGSANSGDFPLVNPVQAQNNSAGNGTNAFLTKIDPSGSTIIYSTYLGGSGNFYIFQDTANDSYPYPAGDFGNGVAVNSQGEAIVSGTTYSLDFPVSNAFQPQNNAQFLVGLDDVPGNDANLFVTKYKADGSGYIFSTYLGGSGFGWQCGTQNGGIGDTGGPVAVDGKGDIYVTGAARSSDFPTTSTLTISKFSGVTAGNSGGAGQVSDTNSFVTALKSDGSGLLFSTFLGGPAPDQCSAEDWSNGCPYTPCEPGNGEEAAVEYDGDSGNGIAVGENGVVYVTGSTGSSSFPVKSPFQSVNNAANAIGQNAFLAAINPAAKSPLVYSTYYGGNTYDSASGVAVDAHGNPYISGQTSSPNLPVSYGAYDTKLKGSSDAFVAKFALKSLDIAPTITWTAPASIPYGTALGAKQLDARANVKGTFVYLPKAGSVLGFGEHTLSVTFKPFDNSIYADATKTVKIAVKKATLTVTAEDQTMKQGAAVPALTYKIKGFVNRDTQKTATSGKPKLTTTATSKSAPGKYPIKATDGTLAAKDYTFTFEDGTLTILK
jgi:hypothetical protein